MEKYKVYYGWAKVGKAQKRESLCVIFLNSSTPPRINKDGKDGVTRYINVCYERYQTEEEQQDIEHISRIYTAYNIFLESKEVRGSLNKALQINFEADKYNVSKAERQRIKEALRSFFLNNHKNYKEPGYQLEIEFGL